VNIHWIHCIEKFFIVQHFWTTCTCPEKQSYHWKFSLYWLYTFYHSGFLSNLHLPWKTDLTWISSLYWNIFYHSGFLSNLRLPWKTELPWNFSLFWNIFITQESWATCACPENRVCPENFHWIEIFLSFRIFEQLVLALKNRFDLQFFTVLKFFIIQDFWATCACPEEQSVLWIHLLNAYFLSFRIF